MNICYTIRKGTWHDLDAMMQMVEHSRQVMRRNGNLTQWVGYPTEEDMQRDITAGTTRIVCDADGKPVGTFALVPGEEPTYGIIDHGRWIDPQNGYATLHRLAAMPNTSGIGQAAFEYAQREYPYLRADTHADNMAMHHILQKHNFVRSGVVYMDDGSPRTAYEWWRHDEVEPSLRLWISEAVLPRYDNFDQAHQRDHALRVIARAMVITRHYPDVDKNMVYAAAAMHDLGLVAGRERHHTESGRIVREATVLRRWFDSEEVEEIARAVEDHRASAAQEPRNRIGCIVAEADKDVEPYSIVRRTIEYGLSHYPTLTKEGHWQRTRQHLEEKYSERGYIKLWLPDSPNREPLEELRRLINDEHSLRQMFEEIFDN